MMLLKFTILGLHTIDQEDETWVLPVVGWSQKDGHRIPSDSLNNNLIDSDGDTVSDIAHAFIRDGSTLAVSWDDSRASCFFQIKDVEVVEQYPRPFWIN